MAATFVIVGIKELTDTESSSPKTHCSVMVAISDVETAMHPDFWAVFHRLERA